MNARLIIDPPFGSYFNLEGALPVYGTFTSVPRPGRFRRVLLTVRPVNGGWINQLGLRNPGLQSYIDSCKLARAGAAALPPHIVSIHGFSTNDWLFILDHLANCYHGSYRHECIVELNASCPNVIDDTIDYTKVFRTAHTFFESVIVKIGPTPADYRRAAEALAEGINAIHCGNTWPTPVGGVSGPPLKPHSLAMVQQVRQGAPPATVIIASGGITEFGDIVDYANAGADYVGVASLLLMPWRRFTVLPRLVRCASQQFCGRNTL